MCVYRLKSGQNKSRGFVANFRQDSIGFIRNIPLEVGQLPVLSVRRTGQNNESMDFKVNRARVHAVGKWLIENHLGFKIHNVEFSEENLNALPVDGIIQDLPEMNVDNEVDSVEEGPVEREQHEESDPPDYGYVTEYNIRPRQSTEIANALNPMNWPTADPSPINEFETSGLASLAFVKLFPFGEADPTKKGRVRAVRELEASSHLLKYAERDPSIPASEEHPNGVLYYPFAEHPRFSFYMVSFVSFVCVSIQCFVLFI